MPLMRGPLHTLGHSHIRRLRIDLTTRRTIVNCVWSRTTVAPPRHDVRFSIRCMTTEPGSICTSPGGLVPVYLVGFLSACLRVLGRGASRAADRAAHGVPSWRQGRPHGCAGVPMSTAGSSAAGSARRGSIRYRSLPFSVSKAVIRPVGVGPGVAAPWSLVTGGTAVQSTGGTVGAKCELPTAVALQARLSFRGPKAVSYCRVQRTGPARR